MALEVEQFKYFLQVLEKWDKDISALQETVKVLSAKLNDFELHEVPPVANYAQVAALVGTNHQQCLNSLHFWVLVICHLVTLLGKLSQLYNRTQYM